MNESMYHADELVLHVALQIVAGVDADATNVFLQMLGKAARKGDAADVVQVRRHARLGSIESTAAGSTDAGQT
jgi:hypothetical protein